MLRHGKSLLSLANRAKSRTTCLSKQAVAAYSTKPTIDINSEFTGLKENEDYIVRESDRDVEKITDTLNNMQNQDVFVVKDTFRKQNELAQKVEEGKLPQKDLDDFEASFAKKHDPMTTWKTFDLNDATVNDNGAEYWYSLFSEVPADAFPSKRLLNAFAEWMAETRAPERRALLKWLIEDRGRRDIVRQLQSHYISAKLKEATRSISQRTQRTMERIQMTRHEIAPMVDEYLIDEIMVADNTYNDFIIPSEQQKMITKLVVSELEEAAKSYTRTDKQQAVYDEILRKPKLPGIVVNGKRKFTSAHEVLLKQFKQGWLNTQASFNPLRAEQGFVTEQQSILNDLSKVTISKPTRTPFPPAAGERFGAHATPAQPQVPGIYDPLDSSLILNNGESGLFDMRQGLEYAKKFAELESRTKFTEQYAGFPQYASISKGVMEEPVYRGDEVTHDLEVTQPLDYLADQHFLDSYLGEFEEVIIRVKKTMNVKATGRTQSYNAFILVGCEKYKMVGYGFGTGTTGAQALTKARKNTRANIRHYEFDEGRIIERIEAKFGGTRVIFFPKTTGDLKAHPTIHKILSWLGVKTGSVKTVGNRHPVNLIYAFLKCLEKVRTRTDIAKARGVPPRSMDPRQDVAERVNRRGIYFYQ